MQHLIEEGNWNLVVVTLGWTFHRVWRRKKAWRRDCPRCFALPFAAPPNSIPAAPNPVPSFRSFSILISVIAVEISAITVENLRFLLTRLRFRLLQLKFGCCSWGFGYCGCGFRVRSLLLLLSVLLVRFKRVWRRRSEEGRIVRGLVHRRESCKCFARPDLEVYWASSYVGLNIHPTNS